MCPLPGLGENWGGGGGYPMGCLELSEERPDLDPRVEEGVNTAVIPPSKPTRVQSWTLPDTGVDTDTCWCQIVH